jgi:hypothetical protein
MDITRMIRNTILLFGIFLGFSDGFISQSLAAGFPSQTKEKNGSFLMKMITEPAMVEEISSARFAFWMCFYGAAGT